jgi:hypothetical protein
VDFLRVKSHLETSNLSYFTFYPKSEMPIKAVIRHLSVNTPAEDICDGLVSLGFDVVSVKQMTTTRRSSTEEPKVTNLPRFLVTLPQTAKSQEIFHLPRLCHIAIKMETYRHQSALTQCHNCQLFGHVWANCKQPPRCLLCGVGDLHKECPERENAASTAACCNCKLLEVGNHIPPIIGAAGTRGRNCRQGYRREYPGLQREGCSPQTLLRLVSPSRRRSEAVQRSKSNYRHDYVLWKIHPHEWN